MVQPVRRNVNDDYRPLSSSDPLLVEAADEALLTLTDLYSVGEAYLKCHGWHPVDDANSETVSGGIVYEHSVSGELSEEPMVNQTELSWRLKLILSIPVLIKPGCVDGEVVWAASVMYYHHGGGEEDERQFDLECDASDNDTVSCVSVIDVLKSDQDGECTRLRGIYNGSWRGLYADATGEMNVSLKIGRHLELWTETTLAGLLCAANGTDSLRVLVIGLAGGQLVSFLSMYYSNAQLTVIEPSQRMVDIAVKFFQFPPNLLGCVSIVNPIDYVVKNSQCLRDGDYGNYDTIIVNMNSSDEPFPVDLLNGDFFNGLLAMLSNHPAATLLVNGGSSTDAVYDLLQESCKNLHRGHRLSGHPLLLREHLLRGEDTHADDINNNEGSIVAARRHQWTLSVPDWQREHNLGHGSAQISGAMDVAHAQQTQVVRLEKFLSISEIESIHTVAQAELASRSKGLEVHSDSWRVLYLQTHNLFQQKLSAVRQRILDAIREVDSKNWHLFDNVDHFNIRVAEYHQMDQHGALPDPKHYDLNSLLTMDIMLSDNESFEGGNFQTYEADGRLKQHIFEQGDALVFVSHKYHCVSQVTAGRRNVMVLEFWYGAERQCPHRCERFGGEICCKDPGQEVYTRQYTDGQQDSEQHADSVGTPLPFRLGSVSTCKEDNREVLELLWEPSGSDEEVVDVTSAIMKPATVENQEMISLSDVFACFGSDSDDDSS